jgi:hypothetical protein
MIVSREAGPRERQPKMLKREFTNNFKIQGAKLENCQKKFNLLFLRVRRRRWEMKMMMMW